MKRLLRIIAVTTGGFFLLFLCGAAALRLLLPPAKARALLEAHLESRLGREVSLGALDVDGISTFRVSDVKISEPPSFAAGTFLTADAFEVDARLWPLFFRRLVVKDILLERPTLTVIRSADGRLNVAGSAASGAPPAPAGQTSDLLISDVRLSRGSLTFVDKSSAALSAVFDPIDIRLSRVSLVSPVKVEGKVGVLIRRLRGDVDFNGRYEPLNGDARLDRFRVRASSAVMEATGRVSGLKVGKPSFTGALTWRDVNPSSFTALIPIPEGLTVDGATTGRLDVSGTPPLVESRFQADFSAAAFGWKDIVRKAPGVPLTARMSLDRGPSGDLNLHDLFIRMASMEVTGGGTLKGSSDTAHTAAFRVETNSFNVDDLFSNARAYLPKGVSLSGLVKATATLEGWTGGGRFVADFDGTGLEARYGNVFRKSPGTPFRLVADGRYATPLAVDLSSVRLDLDKMSMSGRGSYTTGTVRPTYVFRLKTQVFPLSSLGTLMPDARPYAPQGDAVVDMRVSRGAEGPIMSGEATLLSAGATVKQARITDLAGAIDFTNDSLTTAKLTGKLQGDPLQMSLRATHLLGRPRIDADVRAAKLDIGKFIDPPQKKTELAPRWRWAPFPAAVAEAAEGAPPFIFDTKGTLRAATVSHADFSGKDLEIDWDLTSVTAGMEKLTGTAKLRQGAGEAKNIRSLMEGSAVARLILAPLAVLQKIDAATDGALKIPSLERFPFTSIKGDYVVKNGVATVAPMAFESPALSSRIEGTVGLTGLQAVTLRVILTARSEALGGVIGQALAALAKTHTIPMTVTGSLANPAIAVDKDVVQETAKQAVKSLSDSLFKALGQQK